MPAGRPTDLTPKVIKDVTRVLPIVLYLETAADYIGVHRVTLRRWLKRGAREARRVARTGEPPTPTEAIYWEFCIAVKKSLAQAQRRNLEIIRVAAAGQWTAAAWLMERRHPEQWSNVRGELAEMRAILKELRDHHATATRGTAARTATPTSANGHSD